MRNSYCLVLGLAALLLCGGTALQAQPTGERLAKVGFRPAQFFPAGSIFFAGSDYSAEELRTTPYGRAMLSPKMTQLGIGYLTAVRDMVDREGGTGAEVISELIALYPEFEKLQALPLGYGLIDLAPGENGVPDVSFAAVIDALEHADRFDEIIRGQLGKIDTEAATVAGQPFLRLVMDELPFPIHYGRVGSVLMLTIGQSAPATIIDTMSGKRPSMASDPRVAQAGKKILGSGRLSGLAFLDAQKSIQLALQWLSMEGEPLPEPARIALTEIGIDRIQALSFGLGMIDGAVQFGAFAAWPAGADSRSPLALSAEDLSVVPADSMFLWAGRLDLVKLYDDIMKVIEAVDPEQRSMIERQLNGAAAFAGIEPRRFLASIGSSFVVYEEPGLRGAFPMPVVALQPGDADYFERSVRSVLTLAAAALRQNGMQMKLVTSEAAGQPVTSVSVAAPEMVAMPSWVRRDNRLFLGLYPHCVAEAVGRLAEDPVAFSTNSRFQKMRAGLPTSATTLAYFDTPSLIKFLYPTVLPFIHVGLSVAEAEGIALPLTVADVPTPREFAKSFTVEVGTTHSDADGFMMVSRAGFPFMSMALPGMVLGVSAGAMTSVAVQRQEVMAIGARYQADGAMLAMASEQYKAQEGKYPFKLDDLKKAGMITERTYDNVRYEWRENSNFSGVKGEILFACDWPVMGDMTVVVRAGRGSGLEDYSKVMEELMSPKSDK